MDEPVVAKKLTVLVKLVENNMSSVVMGKGEKHAQKTFSFIAWLLYLFAI